MGAVMGQNVKIWGESGQGGNIDIDIVGQEWR